MIPIAGSAYTYTYATLGELVAWIIGWDLILEYAFSNMSVSVGFAAHVVALLDWFGIHILAQVALARLSAHWACRTLPGNDLYHPGWHFGFNIPAFLIVMLLTVVLVRGIRESARTNNILVLVKIVAILLFIFAAGSFIKPAQLHPFLPNGWSGVLAGGSIIFFTYIGFDSVSTASEECKQSAARRADRHPRHAGRLHDPVRRSGHRAQRHRAVAVRHGRRRAGRERAEAALADQPGGHSLHWVRLVVLIGAMLGMISSILVFQLGQARVWFAMSRDRLLPDVFSQVHPQFRTPAFATWVAGFVVGIPAGLLDIGTVRRDVQHRHAVRVCAGVDRGASSCATRAGAAARLPRPVRAGLSRAQHHLLHPADDGSASQTWIRFFVWLIIGLRDLLLLQPPAQRILQAVDRRIGIHGYTLLNNIFQNFLRPVLSRGA